MRLDGEDGAAGTPGMNVARARIYRRSATTPSLPSSTATFTFATGEITGLNNGWTATIPAPDGNPLWISEATAASSGATDTIAPNEWASPVVLVQEGTTTLPASFSPGHIGGAGDIVFTPNKDVGGPDNLGEIRVQGSHYLHPDGTVRTLSAQDGVVATPFGDESAGGNGRAGEFWLMWTDTPAATRFAPSVWFHDQIVPIIYQPGVGWRAVANSGTLYTFTPVATDAIMAVGEAETISSGITRFVSLLSAAMTRHLRPTLRHLNSGLRHMRATLRHYDATLAHRS